MKDPYQILGVERTADKETIKKAYRKLAAQWHPDKHQNNEEAAQKFKEIAEAYDAIENPHKQQPQRPFTNPMSDMFSSFFGGEPQQRVQNGESIVIDCSVSLIDVLNGGTRELKFFRKEVCGSCNGAGGTHGVCQHCQGSGARVIHGSAMTVKTTCHACSGTGKSLTDTCQQCEAGFIEGSEHKTSFEIPKGVENGMRFAFRGQGHPSANSMGSPGHLYVNVIVEPHEKFEVISGGNILCCVMATYTQLVLGDEIDVPTLEGSVAFRIPPNTSPNQKFRLKELGLPVFNNTSRGIYTRGDQLVEVKLAMPKNMDQRYRMLLEELALLESEQKE